MNFNSEWLVMTHLPNQRTEGKDPHPTSKTKATLGLFNTTELRGGGRQLRSALIM